MSVKVTTSAAVAPTQNAVCERAGGAWKCAARALIDEFSLDFRREDRIVWLCAVNNWAANSAENGTGYSPSQWVLGRGIRLPYNMLSNSSRLSLHTRHTADKRFAERVAMMSSAQRAHIAMRYSKSISHAITARHRGDRALPPQVRFQLGDQVYTWRGNNKAKADCVFVCMVPRWL